MSLGYICGALCGISFGTTQQVQVATNRFAPQERYKIRTSSMSQEWRTRVAFCHRYVPRVRVVFQPTLSVRVWCLTLDPLTVSRIILDGKLRLSPYRPSNWMGGTTILVHRIIDHNVVPVHCLKQLQSTAIHVVLVSKPVKILAVYLPLSRHIIDSKLSDWLCGSLPVLMAGNLNSKNVDRNCSLIATQGRNLCDYDDENSCLIYGLTTPTTVPSNLPATPDTLHTLIPKDLLTPVYLTTWSALSWIAYLYIWGSRSG